MIRSFPLLLLLASSTSSARDHFQFDITFFCNYEDRETYNVFIKWFEYDTVSGDEELSRSMALQPTTGRFSFSMEGAADGDTWFSAGYQPRAYITHDCTNDRRRVDYQLKISTLCEIGYTCHYRIIRDLTNNWGWFDAAANNFKLEMTPFDDFP